MEWVFCGLIVLAIGIDAWRSLVEDREASEEAHRLNRRLSEALLNETLAERRARRLWWSTWSLAWAAIGRERVIQALSIGMDHGETICAGCLHPIDEATCHCGSAASDHVWADGHNPVSMGCDCHNTPTGAMEAVSYWKNRCGDAEAFLRCDSWTDPYVDRLTGAPS